MSMDEKASSGESSQLESRLWLITDEDGREEKVSGPGVVGKQVYWLRQLIATFSLVYIREPKLLNLFQGDDKGRLPQ